MVPGLTPWDPDRYHTECGEVTSLAHGYMLAHRTRSWSARKGGQRIARGASAWPHGPYDLAKGGARTESGANARFYSKVGFLLSFWILNDYMPVTN
jgi:hypothetical protein